MIELAFPRKLRLLNSSHFAYVFQQPLKISTPQIAILGRLNYLGYPRIGLTIAKKNIKFARERNRIKRLMRESFRLHQHELPPMDFVVIAKGKIVDVDNHNIFKLLEKLWYYHYVNWVSNNNINYSFISKSSKSNMWVKLSF